MSDIKILCFIIMAAIVSAILRFKNLAQLCFDGLLGFVMGYSFYLLLGYWITDGATRAGFTGLIILCSRPLYDGLNHIISTKLADLIERYIR